MAATRPQVSVCIAVYNCERYIGQAIESVMAQTMGDLELVVADNASTDRTVEIVRSYADPRIRLIRNERNIGAIANFNLAIAAAQAPFVKLVGADDLLYPTCLDRQLSVMTADPSLVMVTCRRDVIDANGKIIIRDHGWRTRATRIDGRQAVRAIVRRGRNLFGEPLTTLFRADAFAEAGGFDDTSDIGLWCKLLRRGHVFLIPEPLGAFRVNAGSCSMQVNRNIPRSQREFFASLRDKGFDNITAFDLFLGMLRSYRDRMLREVVYAYVRLRGSM